MMRIKISRLARAIRKSKLALIACLALLVTSETAKAQQDDALYLRTEGHLAGLTRGFLGNAPSVKVLDFMRDIYYRADIDGTGDITEEDALIKLRIDHAKRRSGLHSSWALHDIDGDAVVAIAEIRQVYLPEARGSLLGLGFVASSVDEAEIQGRLDTKVADRLEYLFDLNNDGVLTFEEVVAGAEAKYPANRNAIADLVKERGKHWSPPILVTPLYDQNGDGTVTEAEFLAPYAFLMSIYDADGDGILNAKEAEMIVAQSKANFEKRQSIMLPFWLD